MALPRSFKEISQNYVTAYVAHKSDQEKIDNRINTFEKRIERLKKKSEKQYTNSPGWINHLIKPIAEAILPFLPGRHYEILGPFGIGAQTSIHFYRNGVTKDNRFTDGNCISITFEPGTLSEGELFVVDHLTNLGRFKFGTIGEMNGMNNPKILVPEDADAKWFFDFMIHQQIVSRMRR